MKTKLFLLMLLAIHLQRSSCGDNPDDNDSEDEIYREASKIRSQKMKAWKEHLSSEEETYEEEQYRLVQTKRPQSREQQIEMQRQRIMAQAQVLQNRQAQSPRQQPRQGQVPAQRQQYKTPQTQVQSPRQQPRQDQVPAQRQQYITPQTQVQSPRQQPRQGQVPVQRQQYIKTQIQGQQNSPVQSPRQQLRQDEIPVQYVKTREQGPATVTPTKITVVLFDETTHKEFKVQCSPESQVRLLNCQLNKPYDKRHIYQNGQKINIFKRLRDLKISDGEILLMRPNPAITPDREEYYRDDYNGKCCVIS